MVLEVVQETGHIPPAEYICTAQPRGRAGRARAVIRWPARGLRERQRGLLLHLDQALATDDGHAFVLPAERDVSAAPWGTVECLLERVAADAVENGRKQPCEVELSCDPESGEGRVVDGWDGTQCITLLPPIKRQREGGSKVVQCAPCTGYTTSYFKLSRRTASTMGNSVGVGGGSK